MVEGLTPFHLSKPVYLDGLRYDYRLRWFLAEMSIPGLFREEVARVLSSTLANNPPIKYARTRLRSVADLVIFVGPYEGTIHVAPQRIAATLNPSHFPKLHEMIMARLRDSE